MAFHPEKMLSQQPKEHSGAIAQLTARGDVPQARTSAQFSGHLQLVWQSCEFISLSGGARDFCVNEQLIWGMSACPLSILGRGVFFWEGKCSLTLEAFFFPPENTQALEFSLPTLSQCLLEWCSSLVFLLPPAHICHVIFTHTRLAIPPSSSACQSSDFSMMVPTGLF